MRCGIAFLLMATVGGLFTIGGRTVVGQGDGMPGAEDPVRVEIASPIVPDDPRVEPAEEAAVEQPNVDAAEGGTNPNLPSESDRRMRGGRDPMIEQFPDDAIPGPLRWRERLRAPAPYPPPTFFDPQMGIPGRGRVIVGRVIDSFFLGVSLQPVGEALRSHLKLNPSVGLIVEDLAVNSPAAAVLQRHDVLTDVDDHPIMRHGDLVQAVQKAGSEEREVKLNVIRAGQPQTVTIRPSRRNDGDLIFRSESIEDASPEAVNEWLTIPSAPGSSMLPSLQRPGADWFEQYRTERDELKKLIEQLRRDVDELRGQIERPPQ